MPRGENKASTRLSPEAWIQAGIQILVNKSIDSVRVEVLAAQLGVTKGSFYWHFKDRAALLLGILQYWRERATVGIVERFEKTNVPAEEKLRMMLELPVSSTAAGHGGTVELAIRAWARRDKLAREAVQQVDAERLRYVASLLAEMGYQKTEAAFRAFMLYSCNMGEALICPPELRAVVRSRMAYELRLLMSPPLPARPAKTPSAKKTARSRR
jgi:AcrR family transcriptional regulator